jgi:hypothetical protein
VERAEIPASLAGTHTLEITMNGQWPAAEVHMVESRFAPATPHAGVRGGRLAWPRVAGAVGYVVYVNGSLRDSTVGTSAEIQATGQLKEYQVLAFNAAGDESFLSEPVRVVKPGSERSVKPASRALEREHAGYTGAGYVRVTRDHNVSVDFPVTVELPLAAYALDVRYANGSGPVNTEDKVAVRTVLVDGDTAGVLVLPQRGTNRWSDWGWSNVLVVSLERGRHTLTLTYSPLDENMNRRENTALLDQLRLTPMAPQTRIPPVASP